MANYNEGEKFRPKSSLISKLHNMFTAISLQKKSNITEIILSLLGSLFFLSVSISAQVD